MGLVLCAVPLVAFPVNRWIGLVLGCGVVLFGLFLGRTALRHHTRYVLGPDTLCADGPTGSMVEWNRLDRMRLAYYSTKRDRTGGWMQLVVGSTGGRTVTVDSSLDGFYDVVERAAQAAEAQGVELNEATRANLASMGITVSGQELAA
jgi:hypothetical protein